MKRKIAEFSFKVYKTDENKIEVAFDKALKVPKSYDSFVATLEIAALSSVQKVMHGIDKGKTDGKDDTTNRDERNNADNNGNPA